MSLYNLCRQRFPREVREILHFQVEFSWFRAGALEWYNSPYNLLNNSKGFCWDLAFHWWDKHGNYCCLWCRIKIGFSSVSSCSAGEIMPDPEYPFWVRDWVSIFKPDCCSSLKIINLTLFFKKQSHTIFLNGGAHSSQICERVCNFI